MAESDRAQVQRLLASHGISLRKSLGQNLLVDREVLHAIADAAAQGMSGAAALEIGPGAGGLTDLLLDRFTDVLAIEKDQRLLPLLREVFAQRPGLRLLSADATRVNYRQVLETAFGDRPVAVVANLPYYVTTPILMRLLEADVRWARLVLMVQREVAERIVAPPGGKDYGALTLAVRYAAQAEIVLDVLRTSFLPQPGVDSAVLRLVPRTEPVTVARSTFAKVVAAAFAQRRKMIANSLASALPGATREQVELALSSADIDGRRRAETLSFHEFTALASACSTMVGEIQPE
ncbi:MAG: 16S rRNA (adenine(1518)-N(6)/adenine(1519)-N(6))-dimethyltransferase RsmA [Firmicutes bacterium]|nr:16S rRNA (adenine(1518)-N(6)/adenine(1519)-N(6))-dimethyltransferase RsmA [Bacillota bacterium]